jgi:hypothetical protein
MQAQDENGREFTKIVHSSDGTMAIDSLGEVWYYDEESGEFIRSDRYREIHSELSEYSREPYAAFDDEIIPSPEERCTEIIHGDVSDLFNDINVGLCQRIEGAVICGKNVTVEGLVTGNIVCFQTVTVTRTGEVRGDVIARKIRKQSGGRIFGSRSEIPFPVVPGIDITPSLGFIPGLVSIFITVLLFFLSLIVLALFSEQTGRVVNKIKKNTVASFFWGLLVWFSILPVFVLLCITLVGIPIALLVYPLAIVATIVFAYATSAYFIGERLSRFWGWQDKSKYIKVITGVVFLELTRTLSILFSIIGAGPLGNLFLVIFIVINAVALTIGAGAVLTSKFGRKPKAVEAKAEIPATPPSPPEMPEAPPINPPPPPGSKNATE